MKMRLSILLFLFFLLPWTAEATDPQEIRIASIFALTGIASSSNLHQVQAVRYAAEELNRRGGVLGKPVKIVEIDNGSTPILSRLAAQKAVEEGVLAVIGASWSEHSLAMAPVLQEAGIPMITPNATHTRITRIGDHIFRTCFHDAVQGRVLARFAAETLDARTAVIIQDIASDYSLGLAELFSEAFTAQGGRITAVLEYRKEEEDFTSMLQKIPSPSPHILFIPGHNESARIMKRAQEMGMETVFLGGDGWSTWNFWAFGGREIRSAYFATHWCQNATDRKSLEFIENFQQIYPVTEIAALAYDATMLLADAMERAGSPDRKKIRDALAVTRDFPGVTGKITMDANGDPQKPVIIMEIRDGRARPHARIME